MIYCKILYKLWLLKGRGSNDDYDKLPMAYIQSMRYVTHEKYNMTLTLLFGNSIRYAGMCEIMQSDMNWILKAIRCTVDGYCKHGFKGPDLIFLYVQWV